MKRASSSIRKTPSRLAALGLLGLLPAAQALESSQPAPSFPALETQRGKVVLVDFWASWCGPCLQALPRYEALRQELHDGGFEVIGVDVDQRPQDGEKLLKTLHLSYPQVPDAQGDLAERYGVSGMPSSYLIDRRGVVRQTHTGFEKNDIEPLRKAVEQLLEEK
ncbi:MAG: TlpA-like family disulfide reductase [Nevskia sp.]|nr:TlpA-like family disulfide reductase [Nevskia sp.]